MAKREEVSNNGNYDLEIAELNNEIAAIKQSFNNLILILKEQHGGVFAHFKMTPIIPVSRVEENEDGQD